MRSLGHAAAIWCGWILTGCALFEPAPVTRQVHGQLYEGPFIAPEAYAAYLRGALAEETQRYDEAETAFLEVTRSYGESAEAWTRLGAVRCNRPVPRVRSAWDAFARAVEADATFAPALVERARCARRLGDWRRAWADATHAARLTLDDPLLRQLLTQLRSELRPEKPLR